MNLEGMVGSLVIGLLGVAANQEWGSHRVRSCLASVGLLIASAVNLRLLTLAAIEFQLDAHWSYVASSYLSWLVPLSLFEIGLVFANLAKRYEKS